MAYNSNKIEGSTLTEDQTAALFEEGFLPVSEDVYRAKDIEEINGHFLMFHHMLATIDAPLSELICWYHDTPIKNLETIARLHSAYERLHPFQDGNGRTGRIIMFRECIKNGLCPFIVQDKNRIVYVTSLKSTDREFVLRPCALFQRRTIYIPKTMRILFRGRKIPGIQGTLRPFNT